MNLARDIEPVSSLKKNPADLIAKAKQTQSPITITQNGRPAAILMDVEAFERQRQALLFLKLFADGERAFRRGDAVSHDEAMKQLHKRVKNL